MPAVNSRYMGGCALWLETLLRAADRPSALARLGYLPRIPVTADGFSDRDQREQWIREKGMTILNFCSDQHRETPLDVFAREPFDFPEEHAQALVQEIAPGVPVRVVRLSTLMRLKREAGRPQDLADIHELATLHGGGI